MSEAEEGTGIDSFHVFGLDLSRPRQSAVTLDGQRLRGVVKVEVDAPAGSLPQVTVVFVAKRVTGVEAEMEPELAPAEVVTIPRKRSRQNGWTPDQDQVLIEVYALEGSDATVEALARIGVQRTAAAVKSRAKKLQAAGLMKRGRPGVHRAKPTEPEPLPELAPVEAAPVPPVPVHVDPATRRERLEAAKAARTRPALEVSNSQVLEVLATAGRPLSSTEVTTTLIGRDAHQSTQDKAHRRIAPILSALVSCGKACRVRGQNFGDPTRYQAVSS